jgi:ferric-dicitrate binding protein FerR (iron transport regulator)
MQHGLAFKDTPLRDVARELSRVYDVEVTIADPTLADKLVTASFTDAPVDVVLRAVTFTVGAHYERTGRSVVILRGVVRPGGQPGRVGDSEIRTAQAGDQ